MTRSTITRQHTHILEGVISKTLSFEDGYYQLSKLVGRILTSGAPAAYRWAPPSSTNTCTGERYLAYYDGAFFVAYMDCDGRWLSDWTDCPIDPTPSLIAPINSYAASTMMENLSDEH